MITEITYESAELRRSLAGLASDMHPELLKRSLKNGLRRVANKIRGQARQEFASRTSLGHRADRAITSMVHRDLTGFRVRVMKSGEKAMHKNRYGDEGPVPLWLEGGAKAVRYRSKDGRRTGELHGLYALTDVEARFPRTEIDAVIGPEIDRAAGLIIRKYQ